MTQINSERDIMNNDAARNGRASVNGAEIYYEVRGDGPPILCISGGFGDGGAGETVATMLADSHTVISYDRRGHSPSPRPQGWTTTSMDEQAALPPRRVRRDTNAGRAIRVRIGL